VQLATNVAGMGSVTCGVAGLAANSSTTTTCVGNVPYAAAVAAYTATATADSGNAITESNEGNNTSTAAFNVVAATTPPGPADIVVQSVTCANVVQGD